MGPPSVGAGPRQGEASDLHEVPVEGDEWQGGCFPYNAVVERLVEMKCVSYD